MTSPIPASALDGAIAIVGTTGAGKTYVAKGAVEQLLEASRRVCIIDPLDVWYGLRTSADGNQPGYPVVVFGGDHADIPISVEAGAELGRLIAEGGAPAAIICTANMTGGETARFMAAFFEALFAGNKSALHLVIDEADAFAPQQPMPEALRMKGAVDKIARRGRVKGFRLLTITQRPAVLDKSVLSQIATLVAMKLTSPQDRKAIEGWIKGNADEDRAKAVLASLAKLGRGEGWIWSPAAGVLERVAFPAIGTLDTSRTPDHGEAIVEARAAAAVDIESIRAAMLRFSTVREAVADASAGHVALREITRTAAAMEQQLAGVEERGYQRGLIDGEARGFVQGQSFALTRIRAALDELRIQDQSAGSTITAAAAGKGQAAPNISERMAIPSPAPDRADVLPAARSGATPRRVPPAEASAGGSLNSAARKMLVVLDTDPPVRRSWQQVATLAGLKARGGHFNAGKKALLQGGFVVEHSGLVEHASPSPGAGAPPSPAEIVEKWSAVLSGAAPKILRLMFDHQPAPGFERHAREEIAAELGMQPRGGHWNAAWKELRDNGLVEVDGPRARLNPEIFGGFEA